jgi:hypothetical protein
VESSASPDERQGLFLATALPGLAIGGLEHARRKRDEG